VSLDDDDDDPGSTFETAVIGAPPGAADGGALGPLPRLRHRQAHLESRLARLRQGDGGPARSLAWLAGVLGPGVEVGAPETHWRAAGLRRSGLVVQLAWPRLSARVGVGVETPLAHSAVDRLLGFDRLPPEQRLPLSQVEWGVLTFLAADALDRLKGSGPGPLGPWDFTAERVGPDPFDDQGLGRVVTVRWPVRLGAAAGSVRLWLPEFLVARWLMAAPEAAPPQPEANRLAAMDGLAGVWRAEAGRVTLARGLKGLRAGGVLPPSDPPLRGTAASPAGPVDLILTLAGADGRFRLPCEALPLSGGGRLAVVAPPRREPTPREALPVTTPETSAAAAAPPPPSPADVPVTLIVELGRVNLTLGRLAGLQPGDVIELGRHSREPVELTSNGRLVARGELVQIDTELGVRVTHVFL